MKRTTRVILARCGHRTGETRTKLNLAFALFLLLSIGVEAVADHDVIPEVVTPLSESRADGVLYLPGKAKGLPAVTRVAAVPDDSTVTCRKAAAYVASVKNEVFRAYLSQAGTGRGADTVDALVAFKLDPSTGFPSPDGTVSVKAKVTMRKIRAATKPTQSWRLEKEEDKSNFALLGESQKRNFKAFLAELTDVD